MENSNVLELKWTTQTLTYNNDPKYYAIELKILGTCLYQLNDINIDLEQVKVDLYQNIINSIQKIISELQNENYSVYKL